MLVVFKSRAYADISMFGDVATKILHMMGLSGEIPGAIVAADVPEALKKLQDSLARIEPVADTSPDSDAEPEIPLATRAAPLIELLENSVASNADVIWEQ